MADTAYFQKQYPDIHSEFIPPFHVYDHISSEPGTGTYCLYHGNLQHPENREAVLYLLKEAVPHISFPIVIAGRNPTADVIALCRANNHCTLVANPSAEKMESLIRDAHIHILPTFQPTGMKLKLLYALFHGRHVIANPAMLHGTGLDACCTVADSTAKIIEAIKKLQNTAFTHTDILQRSQAMMPVYSNAENAQKIITLLQH